MKPVVAIVGRPNVGKSTLFNKIIKKRTSIVDDRPGVTRDRLYRDANWNGYDFLLVDTGGLEPNSKDLMMGKIKQQAEVAINEADVIIFLVDGKAGITALDEEISIILRKRNIPVIVGVNKIDDFKMHQDLVYEFYNLGFENVVGISAEHTQNIGDLLDIVVEDIKQIDMPPEIKGMHIAVIGKPNAGKSSLVNKFLGEERSIVTDIAGTTRDAIDSELTHIETKYILIDTAGIRRKSKVEESLEYYSVLRAIKSMKRADVCVLLIDAQTGITEQDKKIAGLAHEEKKPIIITVNKWDLIEKDTHTMHSFEQELKTHIQFLHYAPVMFISALTGKRIYKLLEKANELYENYNRKISQGILNEILKEALVMNPPTSRKGRSVKIKYILQATTAPPKFILFVNHPDLIHFSYLRYIENSIRESFEFDGVPLEFEVRQKA